MMHLKKSLAAYLNEWSTNWQQWVFFFIIGVVLNSKSKNKNISFLLALFFKVYNLQLTEVKTNSSVTQSIFQNVIVDICAFH